MVSRLSHVHWLRTGLALAAALAMSGCVRPGGAVPFTIAPPEQMAQPGEWQRSEAAAPARVARNPDVRLPADMGLPLVIAFRGDVPEAVKQATRDAAATWNAGLGEEVVVIGPAGRGQQVDLAVAASLTGESPSFVLGEARRSVPGDVWRIDLARGTPASLLKGTVVHELGHMLGLDHSGSLSSVMYQQATGLAHPSHDDLQQARRGVDAYKIELATMLNRWRTAAAR